MTIKQLAFGLLVLLLLVSGGGCVKKNSSTENLPAIDESLYCETDQDCVLTRFYEHQCCSKGCSGLAVNKDTDRQRLAWQIAHCSLKVLKEGCPQANCIDVPGIQKVKCKEHICTEYYMNITRS